MRARNGICGQAHTQQHGEIFGPHSLEFSFLHTTTFSFLFSLCITVHGMMH